MKLQLYFFTKCKFLLNLCQTLMDSSLENQENRIMARNMQLFQNKITDEFESNLANDIVEYFVYHQFDEWDDIFGDISNGYDNCCCKLVLFKHLNAVNIEQKHNEYERLKQCLHLSIIESKQPNSRDIKYNATLDTKWCCTQCGLMNSETKTCIACCGSMPHSELKSILSEKKEKCWKCPHCNTVNNLLQSSTSHNYSCCICAYKYNINIDTIYCYQWIEVQINNDRWECIKCTYSNHVQALNCWVCQHPHEEQFVADIKENVVENIEEKKNVAPKFEINDIIYNLDEKCDIHSCLAAEKVPTLMINYKNNATCTFDNKHLLKHYLHILSAHNTSQDFEHIYNKLMKQDGCDIKHCKIFKRHQRRRINFIYESSNIRENVNQNINDKIHCYYYHSYDIGYKLTKTEESYLSHNSENDDMCSSVTNCDRIALNELLSAKHKLYKIICDVKSSATSKFVSNFDFETPNIQIEDNYNVYSYGYEFVYQLKSDYKGNIITKNYNTLKEEMTQNNTSKLGMKQFDHELKKAEMHYYEEYRKKYMPYMLIEHLLAVMIYCNFTVLQNALSKTYRKQNKNESFEQLVERHSDFYWLGKYLKEAALQFGTYIKDGIVTSFYHGINQEVMFPRIFASNGIKIYCPLST
eukprot:415632_1